MKRKEIFVLADRCVGCHSCELACAVSHTADRSLFGAMQRGEVPVKRIWVDTTIKGKVPTVCRQCAKALCVEACPTGAMYEREDGVKVVDQPQCIGCWMCIAACPFGACGRAEDRAVKCDRECLDESGVPACVRACHTGALVYMTPEEFAAERRKPKRKAAAAV